MMLPDPRLPWPITLPALAILAEYEQGPEGGCALKAYRCPAGRWTIAWGETDDVHPGDTCTKEQGDAWLLEDLNGRVRRVRAMCTIEPSDNELAAMLLLAYNVGLEGLRRSTVLRCHNAGDHPAAARAFALWNKARNRNTGLLEVLPGLTARRAREAALYLTPDSGIERGRMPQAVEPESSLVASPIAQSGAAVTAGGLATGVVAAPDLIEQTNGLLGAVKGVLQPLRDSVGDLAEAVGVPPGVLIAAVLIFVGVAIMNTRAKQRREGWT